MIYEYLKKFVNWYVNNVVKEKRCYIQKNEEMARLLASEKEKREDLEQKVVENEKKVVELTEALKADKKVAMDREKTMKDRIEQLEGKRQKMNQVCVRCGEESRFKFQSLSFCSKTCLDETAESLVPFKTSQK